MSTVLVGSDRRLSKSPPPSPEPDAALLGPPRSETCETKSHTAHFTDCAPAEYMSTTPQPPHSTWATAVREGVELIEVHTEHRTVVACWGYIRRVRQVPHTSCSMPPRQGAGAGVTCGREEREAGER